MSFSDWIEKHELDKPAWKRGKKPYAAIHFDGLPLYAGAPIMVDMKEDRFIFVSDNGDTWHLPKFKVFSIKKIEQVNEQIRILSIAKSHNLV